MGLNIPNTQAGADKSSMSAADTVAAAKENAANKANVDNVEEQDLNEEYTDNRYIIISLVHNYSNYRKANMKVLGQRKEIIGSTISSSRRLAANKGEIEAYFPNIIGFSPSSPEFLTRVKSWLNNIQCIINENDKKLNISFIYNKKSDYLRIKAEEDKIEKEYSKIDRSNISDIKEGLKKKIDALDALEGTKYKYGRPVNVEEYLIYRHCLLYRDVAKDIALINSDPTLRFYIKDEAREAEKQKKLTEERIKAMRNFMEVSASPIKFNAIYVAIVANKNENISAALLKTQAEKNAAIMDFFNVYPDKFNKFCLDKNIVTKAFIETLIVRGELVRAEFNQQISTADGQFIGSNINEAVAYFNNPANAELKAVYENKLKLF